MNTLAGTLILDAEKKTPTLTLPRIIALVTAIFFKDTLGWGDLSAGHVTDGKNIYVGPQVTFLGDHHSNQWRVGGHVSNLKFGKVQLDVSAGYANDSEAGAGAYGYLEMSTNF